MERNIYGFGLIFALLFCGNHAQNPPVAQPPRPPSPPTLRPTPDLSACTLPAVTGPFRANMPSYHFDIHTGRCNLFTYGGCGGNANRFGTIEECLAFGRRCLRGQPNHYPGHLGAIIGRFPGSGWSS